MLLCTLLAVQRSFAVESADGARDGLRLSGLDPAGIFLGKAAAIAVQLAALEVLLGLGVVVLFAADLQDPGLLLATAVAATLGLAAAGTVYGMMSAGLRVRETLLPLLVLPVVAPVLLGATQAWMAALGLSVTDGWKWLVLLASLRRHLSDPRRAGLLDAGGGRMSDPGHRRPHDAPPRAAAALVAIAATAWIGLVVSPPDVVQGDLVRLIYVHPAAATTCYVGFGLCALASLAYLWPRTRSRRWDQLAGASAEVGVMFCVITLVTGSIWGRGSWGVWWTWDARLTLTALLLAVFIGYLALRRTGGDPDARARRSAVAAVLCALVVPVDHEATTWWQTLHQGNTLLRANPLIHGWQLVGMLVSFVAFGLMFAWLLVHRYRVEVLEDRFEDEGLALAIAERRAEGSSPASAPPTPRSRRTGGPTMNAYVAGGWGAAAVILVLYTWRTLRRGRVLARSLPDREKTWR